MKDKRKSRSTFADDVTVPDSSDRASKDGARILVFGPDDVTRHPLPEYAEVTVGRSLEADLYIKDPAMSRVHAVLCCEPSTSGASVLKIRDLGSSNGTKLRGKRLEPNENAEFQPGELIEIGRSTIVVQRGVTLERPRRVWTHSYFELRLEDECSRAQKSNAKFAIMRVRIKGNAQTHAVEGALTAFLGESDLIALYAPSEYDILLADSGPSAAEQAAAGVRFGLSRLGVEVGAGLACYPKDGKDPEALIARAGSGVRGRDAIGPMVKSQDLVIEDPAMKQLYRLAHRIAGSEIGVLILGETGVGKEILAKAVHANSARADRPFLALNCGAFPEELLESELFGHERGAFTGAMQRKSGLLETAEGGSIFLDEIGEMSLPLQVRLLRVIEERQLRRLGGLETLPIDVRFIAATNRDLEKEVARGTFREDLFYRLNAVSLVVPPLRKRKSEVIHFAMRFATEFMIRDGSSQTTPQFTDEAVEVLTEYPWPGNVRELRNVIERAMILASDGPVGTEHFPMEKFSSSVVFTREERNRPHDDPEPTIPIKHPGGTDGRNVSSEEMQIARARTDQVAPLDPTPSDSTLRKQMGQFERKQIVEALESCSGNQTRAAKLLGMSRKTLLRRLDQYGIPRPRKGFTSK